jgi:hypothetical protein
LSGAKSNLCNWIAKAFNRKARKANRNDRQENQNEALKMISFAALASFLGGLCG